MISFPKRPHLAALAMLRRPLATLAFCLFSTAAWAVEPVQFSMADGSEEGLAGKLRSGSLLRQTEQEADPTPLDFFAAALADYRRLTEVLYANGYYSGTINIRIDGREAALIPATSPPRDITEITVRVDPGKPFRFGAAELSPLPAGTTLPDAFRSGKRARAEVVLGAAVSAQNAWRDAGHAKVEIAREDLIADHAAQRLDARIRLAPGPEVSFGNLILTNESKVRSDRIIDIAGLPKGARYSPADIEQSANRLRRTGAFRSVALSEAETLRDGDVLDVNAAVVDALPRRFGAGVEVSNQEGLRLSGFWLHRNFLGGAERFFVEGEVRDIGANTSRTDVALGMRLERPASFGADTTAFLRGDLLFEQEPLYDLETIEVGLGANRILTDHLTGGIELAFGYGRSDDSFGRREFSLFSTPMDLEWDHRDSDLDPQRGHFVKAGLTPYLGLSGTESGAQFTLDGRIYRPLVADRIVAAARLQFGSVSGSSLSGTAPNFLFQSGGGGTVRGQPYQSLGVDNGGTTSGGRSFLGLSGELRGKVRGNISLVGFADAGYIGAESFYDGTGEWHAGAGLGLRYDTAVGPIRLDVAAPVSGSTSDGVQVYIGIGQAF